MKTFFNAKERDAEEWAALFAKADPRFAYLGTRVPRGSKCAIIEAEWQPNKESETFTNGDSFTQEQIYTNGHSSVERKNHAKGKCLLNGDSIPKAGTFVKGETT